MMKLTVIILFFILFIHTNFASDFPFNIERCSADFNGAAYSEKSIICYGTGAVVLQSADQGKTWKQYSAAIDTFDILKVKYYNNSYIGVLDKEYIVVSVDEGINWVLKPLADKDTVVDFDIGKNNYFVLKSNKIEIYDNNFQLNKIINLPDTNNYTEMLFFSNKLYFPLNSGCLLIYDYATNTFESINFKEKGFSNSDLQLCNIKNDNKGNLYILQAISNGLYNIFISSDYGLIWKIYKNNINLKYQIIDDNVFHISAEYFNTKLDFQNIQCQKNSSIVSSSVPDRVFRDVTLNGFIAINDTLLLVCGKDKFIVVSNDGGISWELKCYLQYKLKSNGKYLSIALNYQCVNDSTIYLPNSNGRVFKTIDGGSVWLTQKYNSVYMKTDSYIETYFFNEYGDGFVVGDPISYVLNDSIISRTGDFGENFKKMKEDYFFPNTSGFYFNKPIKKDSFYYFSQTYKCMNNDNIYRFRSYIYELDSNLYFTGKKMLYDSLKIHSIRKINENYAIGIAEETKEPYTDNGLSQGFKDWHYWLIISTDGGLTWKKDFIIFDGGNFIYYTDLNLSVCNDTVYVSYLDSNKYIFNIIDIKEKNIVRKNVDSKSNNNTFSLSGKTYSPSYGISLVNSSISYPIFENYKSDRYTFFLSRTIEQNKNNVFLFAYDIKNRLCFVKLTPKVPTDVEETQTEGYNPYFYSFPPYPIPAKNYVIVKIYWDKYFDMSSAQFSVYNIYGEKVSNGNDITISNSQSYNGELRWDFNSLPAGVYLIKINTKTCQKVIKVLVA